MGLLDRLKRYLTDDDTRGGSAQDGGGYGSARYGQRYDAPATRGAGRDEDEVAVERYRYLLRTAPPDAVEEVHAEAFARLTPQQRRAVFDDLSSHAAATDRPASDDPRTLARSATRSEMRHPGFMERSLGPRGGPGLGTVIGGSMLGTVAGVVIGSAIAEMVLPGIGDTTTDLADGAQDVGQDVSDGFGDFGDLGGGGLGDFGGDF
ncbi:hypothetical protein [Amnibacterium endophyticum]|uniref:Cation-transporting ATPase n=1 Tax=Amnibacterium endophyticum TaxID=2109337 RepID=A0ABW4LEX6_9MICO